MIDPTFDTDEIEKDFRYRTAFHLSELFNDEAPIGWSEYLDVVDAMMKVARDMKKPKMWIE